MQKPIIDSFVCPECHIGHLIPISTTYVHQYGETMICVPNTPGWQCDMCRICQFDPLSVERVEVLIGQAGGVPPNRYQPLTRSVRRTESQARPDAKPTTPNNDPKTRPKAK